MFRATQAPGSGPLSEYTAREFYRLEGELHDGAVVYPTFEGSWGDLSGWGRVSFRRDHHGVVHLSGAADGGTDGTNSYSTVLVLPERYRPAEKQIYAATQGGATGGEYLRVDVGTDGAVRAYQWNHTWLSLAGISFLAGN